MDFAKARPVLEAIGVAAAAQEVLDLERLAVDLELEPFGLDSLIAEVEARGLASLDPGFDHAMLFNAGRQYLACRGAVDEDVLRFLPNVVDDLHTRRALLHAGTIVVDEFRAAVVAGRGVDWARDLVPPAFSEAISDEHVPDLFAASVALAVRLSAGEAPGCVAEEVMMVRLMDEAEVVLDVWVGQGDITRADGRNAASALSALFDLAGDDDVLALFDMEEPADAAVAGHDPINRQMGVVDQRLQAWFHPFGGTVNIGYLRDR